MLINKNSVDSEYLITVITVVYNREETIENTILSIINQTNKNFEFIVIDGNSTDKTVSIIKKYASFINFWVSEPDLGIYDAMNKGINLSTGDYICFINSGDYFYNNDVLEIVSNKLLDKKTIYFGNYYDRSLNEIIIQNNVTNIFLKNINHQSIFYPTIVLKDVKFDLQYRIFADWELNLRLFASISIKHLDIIVANYEGNGLSAKENDKIFNSHHSFIIFRNYGFKGVFLFYYLRLKRKLKIKDVR